MTISNIAMNDKQYKTGWQSLQSLRRAEPIAMKNKNYLKRCPVLQTNLLDSKRPQTMKTDFFIPLFTFKEQHFKMIILDLSYCGTKVEDFVRN